MIILTRSESGPGWAWVPWLRVGAVAAGGRGRSVAVIGNDSAEPRVMSTVWLVPERMKVTETRVPGCPERIASRRGVAAVMGWPANRMITSPGCRPAWAAGPPGVTDGAEPERDGAICAPLPA